MIMTEVPVEARQVVLEVVPEPLLQEVRNLQVELAVQEMVTLVKMAPLVMVVIMLLIMAITIPAAAAAVITVAAVANLGAVVVVVLRILVE